MAVTKIFIKPRFYIPMSMRKSQMNDSLLFGSKDTWRRWKGSRLSKCKKNEDTNPSKITKIAITQLILQHFYL